MSAIEILGLDHVVIRTANLQRSLEFYCGALGCTEERRLDGLGLVQLRAGACLIDLVDIEAPLGRAGGSAPGVEGRNMDHFAIAIGAFDEQAIRAHLVAAGVDAADIGEVGERYGAGGTGPSMYLRDPDGNVVELKGPPSE